MVTTFPLIVGHDRWQVAQLDLTTQRINDPQHVLQSQGGFACLEVDDETHANPCRQSQLGLCQPELLASGTQCIAELSR